MRRILANQDVRTEFEIWSTFLLSKPRVGSDYKFQEVITTLSDTLKAQFRAVCIDKAGGEDFAVLGPFVAAMYRVTKEELDIALAECRATKIVGGREVPKRKMEPKLMPLISFPWLFHKELGRIATGVDASVALDELNLVPLGYKTDGVSRRRHGGRNAGEDDFVEQEDGVVIHRGEELDLFKQDLDDLYGSDSEEAPTDSIEDIYASTNSVAYGGHAKDLVELSGTGVEDVIKPVKLDGLLNDPEPTFLPPATRRNPSISASQGSNGRQREVEEVVAVEEEEEMILPIRESALEKLARMTR